MSTTRTYHDTYEHDRFCVQDLLMLILFSDGLLWECRSIWSSVDIPGFLATAHHAYAFLLQFKLECYRCGGYNQQKQKQVTCCQESRVPGQRLEHRLYWAWCPSLINLLNEQVINSCKLMTPARVGGARHQLD